MIDGANEVNRIKEFASQSEREKFSFQNQTDANQRELNRLNHEKNRIKNNFEIEKLEMEEEAGMLKL
jgi:hypothetical protein